MANVRVVMDTNVLFAGLFSRRGASYALLELLEQRRWKLALSNTVLTEYTEVLLRSRTELGLDDAAISILLDNLCNRAEQISPTRALNFSLPDRDDEALAVVAVEGPADYLVTHNVRHFHPLAQRGFNVVTPRKLLSILRNEP